MLRLVHNALFTHKREIKLDGTWDIDPPIVLGQGNSFGVTSTYGLAGHLEQEVVHCDARTESLVARGSWGLPGRLKAHWRDWLKS